MLHGRCSNSKIKDLQERSFRLIYYDKFSSNEDLLTKDTSFSIEMFKVTNNLTPKTINDLFYNETENNYDLRHRRDFKIPFVNSVYHDSESISYLCLKVWDIVPPEIKQINSLNNFKTSIRKWILADCPYRLCRTYISGWFFI